MTMRAMLKTLFLMLVPLLIAGCFAGTRDIRTMSALRDATPAPLRLMAVDGALYELDDYAYTDSTLTGSGTRKIDGSRQPFAGTLRFDELVYIQARAEGKWITTANILAAGVIAASFSAAAKDHGLRVYDKGDGSCPYLYAWTGDQYLLQGEAFGTSFGRALEGATACLLPDAASTGGLVRVRIANERPETHYVNRVHLLAYEMPPAGAVVLDTSNRAWPVLDPRPPRSGTVTRPGVHGASPPETQVGAGLRDRSELVFARPPGASAGSIIVRAVNTGLAYAAFQLVFGYLDEDTLPFLYEMEHDPGLVAVLRDWIGECSLEVEVADGAGWTVAGAIPPEASAVSFSRIVRITAGETPSDSVRVRLTSLAGLWSVEAVAMDWAPVVPLAPREVTMRSAVTGEGTSAVDLLGDADKEYAMLLPGEWLDLAFEALPDSPGMRTVYALEAGGYLHEWAPASGPEGAFFTLPASLGADRLAVVNRLIRDPDRFLQAVYRYQTQRQQPGTR